MKKIRAVIFAVAVLPVFAPAALGVTWPTWPSTLLFDATATAKVISVQ